MNIRLLLLFFVGTCCSIQAQSVQNPLEHIVQLGRTSGSYHAGRTYYKWVLDINHDGVDDILLSMKQTSAEINEQKEEDGHSFNPTEYGFSVYIGKKSGGYLNSKYVEESIGNVDGGIGIDISQCYVGYVEEVKQYGIVTVEEREVTAPSGKGRPVPMKQVYCYTVQGDHIKRTDLTPLFGIDEKNPTCDKYLSESKRTKVQLQEVTP